MKAPFVMVAAVLLAGCGSSPQRQDPGAALDALVEEYFDLQLELSPMTATAWRLARRS